MQQDDCTAIEKVMLFAALARKMSIYRNSKGQISHRQSNRQLRKKLYYTIFFLFQKFCTDSDGLANKNRLSQM